MKQLLAVYGMIITNDMSYHVNEPYTVKEN